VQQIKHNSVGVVWIHQCKYIMNNLDIRWIQFHIIWKVFSLKLKSMKESLLVLFQLNSMKLAIVREVKISRVIPNTMISKIPWLNLVNLSLLSLFYRMKLFDLIKYKKTLHLKFQNVSFSFLSSSILKHWSFLLSFFILFSLHFYFILNDRADQMLQSCETENGFFLKTGGTINVHS